MNSAQELSIGYLSAHPRGAGAVLEAIAPEDAAAYLKDVPETLAGAAFEVMQPLNAAAILPRLSPKKAADVLLTMDSHARSRVLRMLTDDSMATIMAEMPKRAARELVRYLRFPEGSVGAWVSSDVAVFEKSTTIGVCLAQLRALPQRVRGVVFVTEPQGKLFGAVDLPDLLAAPDDGTLDALAKTDIRHLSPYARLTSTIALPAWDEVLSLPVVDSKRRLLGALHFDRLREGLASEQRVRSDLHTGRIMVHLAEAFLVCAAGVLHNPSPKWARSRPVDTLESGHGES